jgi:hypothetical protein
MVHDFSIEVGHTDKVHVRDAYGFVYVGAPHGALLQPALSPLRGP